VEELLDTAPCGYLTFGDDGVVRLVNTTLLELLGHTRDQVVGAHFESLLTISSRIFYQTHFFPLLRLEGRAEEIFLTLRSSGGESVAFLAHAARRVRNGAESNECVFVPLHQRQKWETEILRAKRAAEDANRAKSGFLSMMSHDLRTPLNAISGYAELMEMGIHGPVTDQQLQDLERIRNASRFLLSLLNDVLSFASLESGQLELRSTRVDVGEAIRRAEQLIEPQIAAAGLNYVSVGFTGGQFVCADPERVQQILLNLLSNAVKFTPSGGGITTECERLGSLVAMRVRDTGPGIPDEHLERIFQPFFQLGGQSHSPEKGVGLGLAISRELARAMGGDLTAESVPGGGSMFTLALPADG
jgi:PAS domain S-box-containing protein